MKYFDIIFENKTILLLFWIILILSLMKPWLFVNGILIGSLYALGSIGLSLIYGNLKFANMAHGDFMTLSSYVALALLLFFFPNSEQSPSVGPFTFKYELLIIIPIAVVLIGFLAVLLTSPIPLDFQDY